MQGNKYILVVSDYFTKCTESYLMSNMETSTVAKLLVEQLFFFKIWSQLKVPNSKASFLLKCVSYYTLIKPRQLHIHSPMVWSSVKQNSMFNDSGLHKIEQFKFGSASTVCDSRLWAKEHVTTGTSPNMPMFADVWS